MAIVRIVIGGRIVGSQRWSVGHSMFSVSAAPSGEDLSAYAEAAFADFKAQVWTGSTAGKLASLNVPQTTCDSARAYFYPDGATVATAVGVSTGAAAIGSASSGTPPQLAIVATLENGLAGRKNRGRMYLPTTSCFVAVASLVLDTGTTTGVATNVANYLSAVRANPLGDEEFTVPVVSGLTATSPLTAVSVDGVVDTQRRRRDKITAPRSRASLVVG